MYECTSIPAILTWLPYPEHVSVGVVPANATGREKGPGKIPGVAET